MSWKSVRGFVILMSGLWTLNFSASPGWADGHSAEGIFQRANVYYEQGLYDEAIRQYNRIFASGAESGHLYYNLGNCYFKKGKLGQAILHYEKARRLIPRDRDLESNDAYASSLVKGGEGASQKSPPLAALEDLFGKLTVDGLTILLSALYILSLAGILVSFFWRPLKKYIVVFVGVAGLFFVVGFAELREKIALVGKEGIVVAEEVDAKFEPFQKATAYFLLTEGMRVDVIASQNQWLKIRRQDNKSGWVERETVVVF